MIETIRVTQVGINYFRILVYDVEDTFRKVIHQVYTAESKFFVKSDQVIGGNRVLSIEKTQYLGKLLD